MIIAFDVSYIQKRRTGYGRSALELLKAMLARDTQNEYILHGWSYSLDNKEIFKFQRENVRTSIRRIPGVLKRFYWNTLERPCLDFFIGEHDVFHSTDPLLPPTKNQLKIITVHDLAYKKFPQFFKSYILQWDSYITKSVRRADAIIVPSRQTKMDIVEKFQMPENKIHVINFPISSLFNPVPTIGDREVKKKFQLNFPFTLFVGTFEPRKNIPRLLKAFEIFQTDRPTELHLVLAGKRGWLYEDIFDAIRKSTFRDKIHYLEYVPDTALASLYRLAEFVVYPSLYEGYGFPVLEAMASGKTVLTSNVSSMKELGDTVVFSIDPYKVEEIAHAMKVLHDNESTRNELSRRGIEYIRNFSSEKAAMNVMELYHSLRTR